MWEGDGVGALRLGPASAQELYKPGDVSVMLPFLATDSGHSCDAPVAASRAADGPEETAAPCQHCCPKTGDGTGKGTLCAGLWGLGTCSVTTTQQAQPPELAHISPEQLDRAGDGEARIGSEGRVSH